MTAIGARSLTAVALLIGTIIAMWQVDLFRSDYWAQLSPWVTFLASGFAVVAGTLVFVYWRLAEGSTYYLRFGEKLTFGDETSLLGTANPTLLVGHAPYVAVIDFAPRVMHGLYVTIFVGLALISLDNRAVALLRGVPERFDQSRIDYCQPPEPPKAPPKKTQGCALVERAYKLGYAKSLGTCAPQQDDLHAITRTCARRQLDEPYLHFAWRRLDHEVDELRTVDVLSGALGRFEDQLDHLSAIVHSTVDTVAMRPRSSHHLFTNLPDPTPPLRDRLAGLERGCGARLAHLEHFPRMESGPDGPSKLFEHVLAQLMFNPVYKPIVAQCDEIVVHWGAPPDACAKIAANPRAALTELGALDHVLGVLDLRAWRAELQRLDRRRARDLAPPERVISFQCLMFDVAAESSAPTERGATLDGVAFVVRDAHTKPLVDDGASQIRLYKQLAALMAPGFGYGRLTSSQAVSAAPEEAAMAQTFRDPAFELTKLDVLRDADLFLSNDWLTARPDLLAVYPYHLHLQNFIEQFRRQYQEHRGRL